MTRLRTWVEVYCHCCGALAAELPAAPDPAAVFHCLGCSALVACPAARGGQL